jgi:polysaccharide biosynthesis/export protein
MQCAIAALALLLLLCSSPAARAQYNGPPSTVDRSGSATPTTDQSLLFPTTPEPVLEPGDGVSIRNFTDPDYNFSGRISQDGTVLLPLIGLVPLQGLSITRAEELIGERLQSAGMYRDPQMIVSITEGPNAIATIMGEMHAVVPIVGSRSLFAVLATGGGLPAGASRTITIQRRGQAQPISVDIGTDPLHSAAANIPIFPGDTILVSRIGVVYVAGEFRSPGLVTMNNYGPLTLTQVSAMVGGPVWDARYGSLHIIRTVGDHRTVTTLNIKDVLYGKAPDPIMQPNDIIFLPPSPIKSSLSNGSLGSVLGVVSFALATFYTLR